MKKLAVLYKTISIVLFFAMGTGPVVHAEPYNHELNVMLIYKLAKFVTWPDSLKDNFDICIYGQNPFGDALEQIEGKMINERVINIQLFLRVTDDIDNCQVLFIAHSAHDYNQVLRTIVYSPVLTISDMKNFANSGGMIELIGGNRQVEFRINVKATKAVNLQLASPLLELATIVEGQ